MSRSFLAVNKSSRHHRPFSSHPSSQTPGFSNLLDTGHVVCHQTYISSCVPFPLPTAPRHLVFTALLVSHCEFSSLPFLGAADLSHCIAEVSCTPPTPTFSYPPRFPKVSQTIPKSPPSPDNSLSHNLLPNISAIPNQQPPQPITSVLLSKRQPCHADRFQGLRKGTGVSSLPQSHDTLLPPWPPCSPVRLSLRPPAIPAILEYLPTPCLPFCVFAIPQTVEEAKTDQITHSPLQIYGSFSQTPLAHPLKHQLTA